MSKAASLTPPSSTFLPLSIPFPVFFYKNLPKQDYQTPKDVFFPKTKQNKRPNKRNKRPKDLTQSNKDKAKTKSCSSNTKASEIAQRRGVAFRRSWIWVTPSVHLWARCQSSGVLRRPKMQRTASGGERLALFEVIF